MLVRPVEPADIETCVELGRLLHSESPHYCHLEYSEAKVSSLVEACITQPNFCGFVAEHDGEIVGMMAGVISQHFFSSFSFATDLTVFVKPESRGSTAAIRLITAFCIWAEAMKCNEIRCGVSTGIREEASDRMYKKFGFVERGTMYVKHIEAGKLVH